MANFLQQLGQGLRIAGASTSQGNFSAFDQQNQAQAEQEERKRQLVLGLLIKGAENGVPGAAEKAREYAQKAGYGDIPVGPGIEYQKMQAERDAAQRKQQYRATIPSTVKKIEDEVFGVFAAEKPADLNVKDDFSGQSAGDVTSVTAHDVVATPEEDAYLKWEKHNEAADKLDDYALTVDQEGEGDLADAIREKAKVYRDKATELKKAAGLDDSDGETEKKIQRYMSIGASRADAIKLVQGGYVVATDAYGRDYVWDKLEKKRVTDLDPIVVADIKQAQQEGEGVDFSAATGVSGAIYRSLNTITGLFGGGLVSEDAEKATNAFDQLRISTIGVAEAQIPGRPSDFQLRLTDTLAVNPRDILTGDAKALQKMRDTRSFLQREIDRMYDVVLANPRQYSPRELSETTNNVSQMQTVVRQYNWAIDQMETKGKPRKSMDDIEKEFQ